MPDEPAHTQAAEALRADVGRAMTDPTHPGHAAFKAGPEAWAAYLDPKYKVVYGDGTVTLGEGLRAGGETPREGETPEEADARARNEVILAPLRQEWAGEFEANFAAARTEARELFAAEDGTVQPQVFEDLGTKIRTLYGPKGEALAIKFLADLGKLRKG